jgi:hypothetical protein
MARVVWPVPQAYDQPALLVADTEPVVAFGQSGLVKEAMAGTGRVSTVTVCVAKVVQPSLPVTVTVYTVVAEGDNTRMGEAEVPQL